MGKLEVEVYPAKYQHRHVRREGWLPTAFNRVKVKEVDKVVYSVGIPLP